MKSNRNVIEKIDPATANYNPLTKTLYEELQISHNVPVYIAINYKTMTLSLIERDGKPKNRLFAERGTSYEHSREAILEAMKDAMAIGFQKLREREQEHERIALDKLIQSIPE